jgi:hypothetical protein
MTIAAWQLWVATIPIGISSTVGYQVIARSAGTVEPTPPTTYLGLRSQGFESSQNTEGQPASIARLLEQGRSQTNILNQRTSTSGTVTSGTVQQEQPKPDRQPKLVPSATAPTPAAVSPPAAPATVPPEPAVVSPPPAAVPPPAVSPDSANPPVRVLINSGSNQFAVGSNTSAVLSDIQGNPLNSVPPMTAITAQINQGTIQVNGKQFAHGIMLQPQETTGFVFLNDRWYRGGLVLIPVDGELWIINTVTIEDYLYSVVGAEMPSSWHGEALKAQAIAARSYALVQMMRNAQDWYHLLPTQRHQVYKGTESETAQSMLAVESTRGLVVSREGGIVEAMYASTDAVVSEAHAGFQSMSQTGAHHLASDGWLFHQILAKYYPASAVSALQK